MSDVVIKVENLSKQYRLGTVGTGTITHDLNRFWARVRGKEDPYLKIGESNNRTKKGDSEYIWALQDINFEVKQGEVLGIIGRNGAGKSTLLKILSQIIRPSTGSIKMRGRVGSLLEVGTGFHPDLTGRENVYINGAILGMRKWEIDKNLDEIIEFAGVERYIDTPVKRYSSGMMIRLGFSVAAHLEPEILIVDEVLAVGDSEFQKKCLGKMGEVSRNDGRTILFVSHSLGAVQALCHRSILIDQGRVAFDGETQEGLLNYYDLTRVGMSNALDKHRPFSDLTKDVEFKEVALTNKSAVFQTSAEVVFKVKIFSKINRDDIRISLTLCSALNGAIGSAFLSKRLNVKADKESEFEISFDEMNLSPGKYFFGVAVGIGDNHGVTVDFDIITEVLEFEIRHPQHDAENSGRWDAAWGSLQLQGIQIKELRN